MFANLPFTWGKLAYDKNTKKIKVQIFQRIILTDNSQFTVLRYNCVKYKFYTATEMIIIITNLKSEKLAQNGTHELILKQKIRSKANTIQ
jgi:hypothetical protein